MVVAYLQCNEKTSQRKSSLGEDKKAEEVVDPEDQLREKNRQLEEQLAAMQAKLAAIEEKQ